MEFILLVGIPASGKSTKAEELALKGYEVFNADVIRHELYGDPMIQGDHNEVFDLLYERLELALKAKKNVVIDNTNVRKSNRASLIAIAHEHGYKDVQIWLFDVPLETCLERNKSRVRVVPEHVLIKMQETLNNSRGGLGQEGKLTVFGVSNEVSSLA